jgi:hypothetical protein
MDGKGIQYTVHRKSESGVMGLDFLTLRISNLAAAVLRKRNLEEAIHNI